jgi:hypothetical protein
MSKWFVAVTATNVHETGQVSFHFMAASKMPSKLLHGEDYQWGFLITRPRGRDEVDLEVLTGLGPGSSEVWELVMADSRGIKTQGSVNVSPPNEPGLTDLLKDVSNGFLLMPEALADRFKTAANAAGYEVQIHQFDGELTTS